MRGLRGIVGWIMFKVIVEFKDGVEIEDSYSSQREAHASAKDWMKTGKDVLKTYVMEVRA